MIGIPAKNVGTTSGEFKPYAVTEDSKENGNEKLSRRFYFWNWKYPFN